MRSIELAWAAGLFDGEGYIGALYHGTTPAGNHRQTPRVSIQITQSGYTCPNVLVRFQRIVDAGRIYGPAPLRGKTELPQWRLSIDKKADVQRVWRTLWPYLCPTKQSQIVLALWQAGYDQDYKEATKRFHIA